MALRVLIPSGSHEALRDSAANIVPVDVPRDEDLVRRILDGDIWAQEAVYRRHFGSLFSKALRLLGNRSDAEDVVQDVFVVAFEELANLRDPAALGGWLLQVTVHQVHRRFRRRRLLRTLGLDRSLDDTPLEKLAHEGASPELCTELARLDRLLARLPSAERVAWMLRHVDALSLEEVAAACQCSLATAKRRIRAADDRIREHAHIERGGGDENV